MQAEDIALLADLVRACALLEKFVREVIASRDLNDTDVWVLIVIAGLLEAPPATLEARSTAWVSSRLGFAGGRVGMSIRNLIKRRLVRLVRNVKEQDGRTRSYLPTAAGLRAAHRLREELVVLEREVRLRGGIARNARAVDPQVVALCLETFSVWKCTPLMGLDRRRVAGVRNTGAPIEDT